MATPITLRRLGEGDVEDYRSIRLAALKTEPEAFGSTHALEAPRSNAEHAERLSSSTVVGAYDGNSIVGMIGCRQESSPKTGHKALIWGFYVRPESRRAGVGAALVAAALDAARGRVEQLTLSVVKDNAGAIALYESFGFTRYGTEPRALKSAGGYADEVLMALRL